MYDMYPDDWGPARNDPESKHYRPARVTFDQRDDGGERPDDN